jgi:hypothetical protein
MHTQQTKAAPQPIEVRPNDNNVVPYRAKVRTLGVFTSNPAVRLAVALEASQKESQLLLPWSTFLGLTPATLTLPGNISTGDPRQARCIL